jgi:xanthine dehydrogenase accessory factor
MANIYQALAELVENNEAGAFCIVVRTRGSTPRHATSKMLVYPDGHILGTVGGGGMEQQVILAGLEALRDGQPRMLEYSMVDPSRGDVGVCGGTVEVFVEPILPKPLLVVIGAGHVGKAVAHLAHWLGFRVAVNDDRPEFCTPESVPDGDEFYACLLADLPNQLKITPWSYLVLTTRGMDVDVQGLPALLATPAAYVGVIGSQRRWSETRKKMIEAGVSDNLLARVYSPIGLDIRAETPEEIAVSIMSEIIALRAGSDLAKSGVEG